jgi:hypothetical protein
MKVKPYSKNEQPLTVGELIQKLSKLDPDKEVFVSYVDHTDYQYRTPLRLNEIRELNVGIEREVDRDDEGEYDVDYIDYIDTNIVDIEMVEHFEFDDDDDDLPF